jgi:CarD family transcriptional regulator
MEVSEMFKTGDYIHYSTNGLCRVAEVTTLDFDGADKSRLYYRLIPVDGKRSTIFTPVDNTKVAMRLAMTREEAEALIDSMPGIETLLIPDEKTREQIYRNALLSQDGRSWVQIIKTLYRRRQIRLAQGRKATSTDEKYLRSAEELLYSELALALGMHKEEMEGYIVKRLETEKV